MNNKQYINEIFKILYDYIKQNNTILTRDQIYNYLTQFGVDSAQYGSSISDIREEVVAYVNGKINDLSISDNGLSALKRYRVKDQGQNAVYFTHMNVSFKGEEEAPTRDVIKMYIPFSKDGLDYNLKMLYNFLFDNGINFQSKLSNDIRCDIFVLRLDSKADAKKVIDFCNNIPSIKGTLGYCNPFVPTESNIGIAHDTHNISYNGFLANVITEYLTKAYSTQERKCDFDSFFKYVTERHNDLEQDAAAKGDKAHFMYSELAKNLDMINRKTKPLDALDDGYNVMYNHELFTKYKRYMDKDHNYQYMDLKTKEFVPFKSQQWIELQAMNFLAKLYEQSTQTKPMTNYAVNDELISYCLSVYDKTKDGNYQLIPSSYQNENIDELYTYFYAYLGLTKRDCSLENALLLADQIRNNMVKTNNKQEREYKNVTFVSSIPIINIENATIGIELLDGSNPNIKGLCNICVIKDGKITKYSNVFIDLDYSLLYPNDNNKEYASVYRASIGQFLSDLERNKRMMDTRDGHFGIFKFDEQKGIKKYQNPEYISMMAKYKEQGLIPEKYQEEGSMIR